MCAGLKDKSHVHMATILWEFLVSMGQLGAERESETRRHPREAFAARWLPRGSFCSSRFSHHQRSHGHVVPCLASVFQLVDMMGWRLQTADGVDIPVSFNPGSSSVVADLQELPATVHSASWVAPPSYLGDKVTTSCCSPVPLLDFLHHYLGIINQMLGRKVPEVQITKIGDLRLITGFPHGSVVKNPPANTGDSGDLGSIPGSRRSPGGGKSNPLHYSCLENLIGRGAWRATVHRISKGRTQLSDWARMG